MSAPVNRRAFVAGITAAATAPSIAANAAANPDAELIALCRDYRAASQRRDEIGDQVDAGGIRASETLEDAWDAAWDTAHDLSNRILEIKPVSHRGLMAKVAVAHAVILERRDGSGLNYDERFADAVISDVLALGGGSGAA